MVVISETYSVIKQLFNAGLKKNPRLGFGGKQMCENSSCKPGVIIFTLIFGS